MPPATLAGLGLPWTPEEAAAVLAPRADADLLRSLVILLGLPEVAGEMGRRRPARRAHSTLAVAGA